MAWRRLALWAITAVGLSGCGMDLSRVDGSLRIYFRELAPDMARIDLMIEYEGRRSILEFEAQQEVFVESVPVGLNTVDATARNGTQISSNRVPVEVLAHETSLVGLEFLSDPEADTDGDGLLNRVDNCLDVANVPQDDGDRDGVGDACDVCPDLADPLQEDLDLDGYGDSCDPDVDGDAVLNVLDACPRDASGDLDADFDEVCDSWDNCPFPNPNQLDCDRDGAGDACDQDVDGDGVANGIDVCPFAYDPEQIDSDGDGVGDECALNPAECRRGA